jgi:hypothetical protein
VLTPTPQKLLLFQQLIAFDLLLGVKKARRLLRACFFATKSPMFGDYRGIGIA